MHQNGGAGVGMMEPVHDAFVSGVSYERAHPTARHTPCVGSGSLRYDAERGGHHLTSDWKYADISSLRLFQENA